MGISIAHKLAYGVSAWLEFEFQCHRSALFSEKYLSFPIGQILTTYFGSKVYAEVVHPVLAGKSTKRGRKPEVDFAVLNPYPEFKLVIESKWVGDSLISLSSIVWDLIRLEIIAHTYKAEAIFLLAGKKTHLDKLFSSEAFVGATAKGKPRPLLNTEKKVISRIALHAPIPSRLEIYKHAIEDYPKLEIPSKILTSRTQPYPLKANPNQYQVYTWKIMPVYPREVFTPENHSSYK